jgi:hypothetical protein
MAWFMVCWSLPIIIPVEIPKGTSHSASEGLRRRGLVQIAFWSLRKRLGVPERVTGSGGLVAGDC